ncbi:hypothetical protein DSO57_1016446 [Entomophthora muscae]|uniref:Uncharacterized protein n=2 Tax=Entomophthora muscae TaxID=34485 RepID=A0ACC2T4Y2_9FUNG|nr:hypothetical protein DSO57_1016445 [Entomophthora muscae]KAJ9069635.1 hypothetical protein DSO57_1016446 [Entomophthora muscae]
MKFVYLLPLAGVLAHMEMTEPAPRRSKYHKGYNNVDYDMTSPLGGRFSYPCRGFPSGPVSKKYTAGQDIQVNLGGSATHKGGHCQFALSFNGKDFVTIHTVFGTCPQPERSFSVQIPQNFPNGKAVFAWVWNNREGNRELYMNCADIEISGGSGTSYTGPELLIANFNVPGKKVHRFPEGFANDFGKDLFAAQPKITISSSNTYQPTTGQENEIATGSQQYKKGEKQESPNYQSRANAPAEKDPLPEYTRPQKPQVQNGTFNEPQYTPNNASRNSPGKSSETAFLDDNERKIPNANGKPNRVSPDIKSGSQDKRFKQFMDSRASTPKCSDGGSYCQGDAIGTCFLGQINFTPCSYGTKCISFRDGEANCQ